MGVIICVIVLFWLVQFGYTIILEIIDIVKDLFSGLLKWGVVITVCLSIVGYMMEYFNKEKDCDENKIEGEDTGEETEGENRNQTDSYCNADLEYNEAYQVLGCVPSDDFETIKQAYHNLIKQYHPDNYHGKPQEFVELANEKMKKIIDAYEAIKKLKGLR